MEASIISYISLCVSGAILTCCLLDCGQLVTASDNKKIYIDGDVILGALFPVHHKSKDSSSKCGEIWEQYGIQRIEAFLLVLEQINNDTNLLPNVTLGCDIRDSCWYTPKALEESKDFIRTSFFSAQGLACNGTSTTKPIAGVIGPGSSSVTENVQNMLAQFQIPEIGYSATAMSLSDTELYPFFLRVVSPDSQQAQALADLVKAFGWTYISTIHSDNTYGLKGIEQFKEIIGKMGICSAADATIGSNHTYEYLNKVISQLLEHGNASVVVCFCDGNDVSELLKALDRRGLHNSFTLIGSDGWNTRPDVVDNLESIAQGSLSIQLASPPYGSFESYYLSLNPLNNNQSVNPWFTELWEYKFNCTLNKSSLRTPCTGQENLSMNFSVDGKIGFVADAMYTAAHALHNMINHYCPDKTLCSSLRPLNGTLFYEYMLKVNFTTYSQKQLYFDKNGDPPGKYQVMNYQKFPNDTYGYVEVATWERGELRINGSIQWGKTDIPSSLCSEKCPKGYAKRQQKEVSKCCWICEECSENDIITVDQKCEKCPQGSWPNSNLTDCEDIEIEHILWTDVEALLPFTFALVGIAMAVSTLVIIAKNNHTAIVKASTRELSYVILVGILLAYISTIAFIIKPTIFSCYVTRILPGLSFSMIYGSVLTKTNRIARILARGKKKIITKKPRCMTTTSLVVVTFFLIGLEAIIIIVIIIWHDVETQVVYPSSDTAWLQCEVTSIGILGPLGFDFFLIGLCTFYAVNTRNVPANFNEAKFIGFCMYVTCVIWIAFVPLQFGNGSPVHNVIIITLCISLSATVALILLFWPKVYVILWHPERNQRSAFTTTTEVRCHVGQTTNTCHTNSRRYSYGLSKFSKRNTETDIGYGSDIVTICDDLSPCEKSSTDFGFYCCKALSKRSVSCQVNLTGDLTEGQPQTVWDISSEESCLSHGCTHFTADDMSLGRPPCYKSLQAGCDHFRPFPSLQSSVHRRCVSLKQYPTGKKIRLCRNFSDGFNTNQNCIDLEHLHPQPIANEVYSRNSCSSQQIYTMSSSPTEETQLVASAKGLTYFSNSTVTNPTRRSFFRRNSEGNSANRNARPDSALLVPQQMERRKLYPTCELSLKRVCQNGLGTRAEGRRSYAISSGDSTPRDDNMLASSSSIEDMLLKPDTYLISSSPE